jgi:hypothetical protein
MVYLKESSFDYHVSRIFFEPGYVLS